MRRIANASCQLYFCSLRLCCVGCSQRFQSSSRCEGLNCCKPNGFLVTGLPSDEKQRDATLPTPDPSSSSKTAGLVNQQLPYMVPTYVRPPPMFEKGEGCYMWDVENRKYLDFTAGIAVNALGHCDEGVSQVIAAQVCSPTSGCVTTVG